MKPKKEALKKQRSISPRKVKGLIPRDKIYQSLETLSTIQVRHQHDDNRMYIQTLQRIKRQLDEIEHKHYKGASQVSMIRNKWIHKRFT